MIRDLFFGHCNHENVRQMEKRVWEHRCDKCNKLLYSKEEGDYCIVANKEFLITAQNDDALDPLLG